MIRKNECMIRKYYVFLLMATVLLLGSCAAYRQAEKQKKADEGYLQFVNPEGDYPDGVEVYINDEFSYIALVTEDKDHSLKKFRWPVTAGKMRLKVVYEGEEVYRGTLVLRPGETKQILLPRHAY